MCDTALPAANQGGRVEVDGCRRCLPVIADDADGLRNAFLQGHLYHSHVCQSRAEAVDTATASGRIAGGGRDKRADRPERVVVGLGVVCSSNPIIRQPTVHNT